MATKRRAVLTASASFGFSLAVPKRIHAQTVARKIRIGVLTDMSGPYKDLGGPNVAVCARQAVQDSGVTARGLDVEVLVAKSYSLDLRLLGKWSHHLCAHRSQGCQKVVFHHRRLHVRPQHRT